MLSQKGLSLGQHAAQPAGPPPAGSAPGAAEEQGDPEVLNRSVSTLELSVRARKCLQRLSINTIGELTSRAEASCSRPGTSARPR